jgi:hypothetical protein
MKSKDREVVNEAVLENHRKKRCLRRYSSEGIRLDDSQGDYYGFEGDRSYKHEVAFCVA